MARPGRPKHEPTENLRIEAQSYGAVGVPHHHIAKLMGITTKTLLRYYRHELDLGKAKANYTIGKRLYDLATADKVSPQTMVALIFWLKAQAGWRETNVVQNQQLDENGHPINPLQPPAFRVSFKDGAPGQEPKALPAPTPEPGQGDEEAPAEQVTH